MWKLVIEDDEARRTVVPLSRDAYDVGRSEDNAIRLTERNVSRKHARVERKGGPDGQPAYRLEDLASLTGVFVNGVRLEEPVSLVHGDLVVIGEYRITIEDETLGPLAHESTNPELKVTQRGKGPAPAYRLFVASGPDAGKVFLLDNARTILGRAEDATIQLAHPSVSRHHAEVAVLPDGRLELIDSGSSNGLILNGKTVRREILEGGDLFEMGDVRVRVLEPGAPVPAMPSGESLEGDRREGVRAWLPAAAFVIVIVIGGLATWLARQPHDLPSGGTVGSESPQEGPAPSPGEAVPAPSPGEAVPALSPALSPEVPRELPSAAPRTAQVPTLAMPDIVALCKHQECDRAREALDVAFAADDPRLGSPEGQVFFGDWSADLLGRARLESDPALKRHLLDKVRLEIRAPFADRERAKRALALIVGAVEREATPHAPKTAHHAAAVVPAATPVLPAVTGVAGGAASPAGVKTNVQKPSPERPGPRVEDPDKIRALMMGTDAEKHRARDYLYARMQHGQASRDELKGLLGLCKDFGDAKCVDEVRAARNQESHR